jgi:hypothetical protein
VLGIQFRRMAGDRTGMVHGTAQEHPAVRKKRERFRSLSFSASNTSPAISAKFVLYLSGLSRAFSGLL